MTAYKDRICTNCSQAYTPRRHDQVFCGKACGNEANTRELLRGKLLYRALYYWLSNKEHSGSAMGMVSKMGREWIAEDKAKGRPAPPPPELIQTRMANARYEAGRREARLVDRKEAMQRATAEEYQVRQALVGGGL